MLGGRCHIEGNEDEDYSEFERAEGTVLIKGRQSQSARNCPQWGKLSCWKNELLSCKHFSKVRQNLMVANQW